MGMVTRGVLAGLVARVLSPYTGVETPGEVERCTGGHESEPVLIGTRIHRTAGAGGNGSAEALAAIMMNNGTTGGTGIDGLLGSALGLNRAKLTEIRAMGLENWRSA